MQPYVIQLCGHNNCKPHAWGLNNPGFKTMLAQGSLPSPDYKKGSPYLEEILSKAYDLGARDLNQATALNQPGF